MTDTSTPVGRADGSPNHSFRLFRHFVVMSMGAAVVVLLLGGLGLRNVLISRVIAEAEKEAVRLAQAMRDLETEVLIHTGPDGHQKLAVDPQDIPELDRRMRMFLVRFNIVKIKFYDRDARIIYSTDANIIGKLDPDNAGLAGALEGVAVSTLESKDVVWDLAEEERLDADIVETYVPLSGVDGRVLGSFKIYKDDTADLEAGRKTLTRALVGFAVALLAVFAALSALMYRAACIIRSRTAALVKSREELSAARERTEDYSRELERTNRQLEQSIDRANQMAVAAEASSMAKSEFLANMSHEIRTPMTAILGFTENMLDPNLPDSDRLSAIHTVRRNGEYLLGVINDILDLSKIEAGKMTVERIACSPCEIAAEVASLVRARCDEKGLTFNIEFAGPVPETIRTDPARLRQILINLVSNAVKFTETGSVRLVTRLVIADCRMSNNEWAYHHDELAEPAIRNPQSAMLQFDVVDTGLGMTEEQVAEVFRPFAQADASTTRKFGGTGLGLAISKCFAEMLGGDITVVDTRPGVGTRFRITVATGPLEGVKMLDDPVAVGLVGLGAAKLRASADQPELVDCRILLAEDSPDNQRLISFVLKKAGAEVTVKENGKLAIDAALVARDESKPFDVILMDMQMPVMGGYEATSALRQEGYTAPIIALTAHAMAGDRQKCLDAGCDDYASKPIDRKKLIKTIQRFLQPVCALSRREK